MRMHWENINWETDDAGTSRATLADEEQNSLTLENRDGTITFHTEGSPRFDASAVMDIMALSAIMSRSALEADRTQQSRAAADTPLAGTAEALVPEQRDASLPERQRIETEGCRLAAPAVDMPKRASTCTSTRS
ncbi:MAG TPA: hypothetical protein VGH96_08460 [Streptosporangiaceae bacterium]|jgi:hypothetical protein